MVTVGIRQLKARLSSYIGRARRGEVVQVTDRGTVVAELRSPAAGSGRGEAYDRLVAEGRLMPATKRDLRPWLARIRKLPKLPKGTAQKLLDEDREERF